MDRTYRTAALAVGLLAVSLSSCGGYGLHPVRGKVTVKGVPARGARVVFHPVGATAADLPVGFANDDGAFELATSGHPGAPAGRYQVTVTWRDEVAERPKWGDPRTKGPDRLNRKYEKPDTSGLVAEVKRGTNDLPAYDLN